MLGAGPGGPRAQAGLLLPLPEGANALPVCTFQGSKLQLLRGGCTEKQGHGAPRLGRPLVNRKPHASASGL